MKHTLLPVLVAFIIFLCGCKKEGNYYQIIPAESVAVATIDLRAMAEKAELESILQGSAKTILTNGMDAETLKKIEEILANGTASGIALNEKIFIFGLLKENFIGIVAKTNNENKLKELFHILHKQNTCGEIIKEKGINQVAINGGRLTCFFDSERIVLIVGGEDNTSETIAKWWNQAPELSITSDTVFQKMITQSEDLNFMISANSLMQLNTGNMPFLMPQSIDWTKMNIIGSLNFETGKIAIQYEYISADKQVMEQFKKQMEAYGKLSNKYLADIPETALIYTAANINGSNIWQQLKEMPAFEKIQEQLMGKGIDLQKTVDAFDGDLSLGLLNISEKGMPSIVAYAETKDNYPLQIITELQKEYTQYSTIKATGKDAYEINIPFVDIKIWVGIKNNTLYLTNDPIIIKNIGQQVSNPLSNSIYASGFKNTTSACIINIGKFMENPNIQMLLNTVPYGMFGGPLLSGCDYIEITCKSNTQAVINIYLKNKDGNALKTMKDGASKFGF